MIALDAILPLHLADVTYPDWHPRRGVGPVYAFAVRTPSGVVLVDTGIGPPHPVIDRMYSPARYDLAQALAAHGIAQHDVTAVVNTHLHFDHCGWNRMFPSSPIFVQAAEYEATRIAGYTITKWVDFPGARYERLSGDAEIVPGVMVVCTPGHTEGHQSVVIDTAGVRVVLAGQAAETADEYRAVAETFLSAIVDHPAAAAVRRLQRLGPWRVYFSHDHACFEPGDVRRPAHL